MTLLLETWLWTTAVSAGALLVVMGLQRLLCGPAHRRSRSRGFPALLHARARPAAGPPAQDPATRVA